MKKIEKNKKKFKLFDMNRNGKGVYEQESRKPNLKFFFVLLFRKFTQLLQLNLIMLAQVIPIVGVLLIVLLGSKTFNSTEALYAPLFGVSNVLGSGSVITKLDLVSKQLEVPLITPWMLFGIIVLALFLFVTFGWQNVGAAYVLRGLFRGDPVFVFSDFFYGIKRNWKQGLIVGFLDFICSTVLITDIYVLFSSGRSIMLGIIVAVAIIYVFMRFYLYQLLITFELKTFKLLKNALIFSVLGIFRNIVAGVGILLLIVVNLFLIWWLLPLGISIPIILPFFYLMAVIGFISVYAAYPVIDKYMIKPYENENNESENPEDEPNENDGITEA